jgi:competence/damage-inducible protein CinA-like protein
MPVAEIITIGTELLLGEIQDTNTRYLARILRDNGIDLYRTMMVGDNPHRVAEAVNEALQRSQIVITTGGLGPTVDDPTREAIALAFGVSTEYKPELWDQIQNRFMRFNRNPTENNRRQAYIPAGGFAVENPVGTAPAFIMERDDRCVFCLPGVPKEMEYLIENAVMPYLRTRYHLTGLIKAKVLHTIGLGESTVDDKIGDLELLSNPTVGLLAHSGQVDVRITAKAESETQADQLIAVCEQTLRERLGTAIYGSDSETIEGVITALLTTKNLRAVCVVAGLDGNMIDARMRAVGSDRLRVVDAALHPDSLLESTPLVVRITLEPSGEKQNIDVYTDFQQEHQHTNRSFGGPPALASLWAVNAMFAAVYEALIKPD